MRTPNYRQAKRHREESRKAKQQQKLDRKQQKGPEPGTSTDAETPVAEKVQEDPS
jgi:hypothetical protein